MAYLEYRFRSRVLNKDVTMNLLMPDHPLSDDTACLLLLHGYSDDHSAWMRKSSIETHIRPYNAVVVMPDADHSFYTNMASGRRYYEFVAHELPEVIQGHFRLSESRERNFAAGLSMGGYGAFRMALGNPDRFAAAASLSGALDVARFDEPGESDEDWRKAVELIWGHSEPIKGSENDLLALVERLGASDAARPRLYQCCGDEDFLYDQNLVFLTRAKAAGVAVEYVEDPGCAHTWDYWDRRIQSALDWMKLPRSPA
jgi:putative tributyrin esterase